MQDAFSRMELLVGNTGVKNSAWRRLQYSALAEPERRQEALARCGVGSLTLIDHEKDHTAQYRKSGSGTSFHFGNEQGRAKKRIRDIDENILVHTYETFYNEETGECLTYVLLITSWDALGTMSSKCF